MLRFFLFLVFALLAVIWVDLGWSRSERTVTLRVRSLDEVATVARQQARALGESAVQLSRSSGDTPPVAAPPEARSDQAERLTHRERERLTRLVEEKTRGD